jgi:hypothetical protein
MWIRGWWGGGREEHWPRGRRAGRFVQWHDKAKEEEHWPRGPPPDNQPLCTVAWRGKDGTRGATCQHRCSRPTPGAAATNGASKEIGLN